jgi:hypothetical protein
MRGVPNLRTERYRAVHPVLGASQSGENWGYFEIQQVSGLLRIIASDGTQPDEHGWEHVSVSLQSRAPKWDEMAMVKELFWRDDETVVQFHPAKSEYVNFHENCLHLWRHREEAFTLPPTILIGPTQNQARSLGIEYGS